ncbi:LXG domain-containing protein [Peribacillus glennii]|uniref:Transposase n=1 Tax=Peribacillus glennii TaxID=2303991 RepID=A0A372LHB0_9BACI|nr:LXG domain-containing protein [Peribacillus glennii]RFU65384.1 transposase [Peribacillus glennii]
MKVLDVSGLENGIKEMEQILKSQKEQAERIEKAITDFNGLANSFSGKGGNAIRAFYDECHLPFIQSFHNFLGYYSEAIETMKKELNEFEPVNSGFISQSYLEHDIDPALNRLKNTVSEMTVEANGYIAEVSDIAYIPRIEDRSFQGMVQSGQKKMDETIEKLNEYDKDNVSALDILEKDAQNLKSYITKIESLFQSGGLSISTFKSGQLEKYEEYNKVTADLIRDIWSDVTNPFGQVNDRLSWADAAFISTHGLSLFGSTIMAKTMEFKYVGGKPNVRQMLKGDFRFSVRASDSWTSRGNYSSYFARKFRNFQASSPTSWIGKFVHRHAATYRTPSDFIKHLAGYPKNMNGIMRGTDLYKSYFNRIESGSKEIIKSVAKAKGFTTTAKRIPIVGTAISYVSNLGELVSQENKDKTLMEKAGRTIFGIGADTFSVAAGAKGGAVVGALIGGPPGAIIGGAVGAVGGAFVGAAAGGKIKDLGEKAFGGLEKGFKSIKKWFK